MGLSNRRFKDAVYEQIGRVGKAVASPRRLELLDLLAQGPRTVEVLAHAAGQSVANTSQHLQVLRAARLLVAERSGLHVTYQLADAEVGRFYRALRLLAESHLSELDRIAGDFLESRGLAEAVDRDALVERVRRGTVTVLDVRPREEYAAGHIAGAVSVPLPELERRLGELPKDREIVAYCRGRFCVLAVEAVVRLRAKGYRAVRLEDGVQDWRARGFRITVGT